MMLRFLLGLTFGVWLLLPAPASAWVFPRRVEVVQYYSPAPVVTSYYYTAPAPVPVVQSYSYVAPAPVVYASPAPAVTTYYRAPVYRAYYSPSPLILYGP